MAALAAAEGRVARLPEDPRPGSVAASLTSAADQVVALAAAGLKVAEIAERLDLAPGTVTAWLRLRAAGSSTPGVARPAFHHLAEAVGTEAGVPSATILSRRRDRPIVLARHELIARAVAAGWTEREIAGALRLDISTVRYGLEQARQRSLEGQSLSAKIVRVENSGSGDSGDEAADARGIRGVR